MVVAIHLTKTQATSSKKNNKNHAGSDDDDIPLVPPKKSYKTTESKLSKSKAFYSIQLGGWFS